MSEATISISICQAGERGCGADGLCASQATLCGGGYRASSGRGRETLIRKVIHRAAAKATQSIHAIATDMRAHSLSTDNRCLCDLSKPSLFSCLCPLHHMLYSCLLIYVCLLFSLFTLPQPSIKTFRTKVKLAKAQRQNRPLPQWIRMKTDNTIKWNAKRRHWRRTKLGL
jgi:large subunit ribosomal protein L39e